MKKFEFELEEILNIRRFEQQQAEVELGKALAEEKKVQDKIDNLLKLIQRFSFKYRFIFFDLFVEIIIKYFILCHI